MSATRFHRFSVLFAAIAVSGFAPARATASLPTQGVSLEAGVRRWHAARPVAKYSAVNMRYGSLHSTIPITSWGGTGPAISFYLSHDSASALSGSTVPATSGAALGKGWTHSYGVTLKVVGSTATLVEADGSMRTFTEVSTNTWVPSMGYYDTFSAGYQAELSTNGYMLVEKGKAYRQFDEIGRLRRIVDTCGNAVTLTYGTEEGETRLQTVTDATTNGGRSLVFDYNGLGQVTSVTAPLEASTNRIWQFDYTTNGDLEYVYSPIDANTNATISIDYGSNTNGLIESIIDPNGNGAIVTYVGGKVSEVADPGEFDEQTQSFTWNTPTAPYYSNASTDRAGNGWTYRFSYAATNDETVAGNLLRLTDPLVRSNSWTYDDHEVNRHNDPAGNQWDYEYSTDGLKNLTKQTDPLENETTYTYDGVFSKMVQKVEPGPGSIVRINAFDLNTANGLVLSITDATTANQTTMTYYLGVDHPHWRGLLKSRTDRNGVETTFTYDDYGQIAIVEVDAGEGNLNLKTHYYHNKAGWRTGVLDANSNLTTFEYDHAGRLLHSMVDPGGLEIETAHDYDLGGRRIATTNPRGTVTAYLHDDLDRVKLVTADVGGFEYETHYDFDTNGNRASITDACTNLTEWFYDEANQLITLVDACTSITIYDYDTNGNRVSVLDGEGRLTETTYDALNRVTQVVVDVGGEDLTTQYEYSDSGGGGCGCGGTVGKGLVRHMIDADGKHTWYEYDVLDRRTAVIRKVGDTGDDADTNDAVTHYTYDPEGRMTSVTVENEPDNLVTTHAYDAAGRLTQTIVDAGTSGLNLTTTNVYDDMGNLIEVTSPIGDVTTHGYDAANRRYHTADSLGLVETLTLDDNGNATKRVVPKPDGSTNVSSHYEFDALDRMDVSTNALGHSTTYDYNSNGQLTAVRDANTHWTHYAYDGMGRRILVQDAKSNTVEYKYDGVGNLERQTASNSGFGDPQVTEYLHDGGNRRTLETYPDDESGVYERSFTYNGVGQVETRTDQNGDVTTYGYDDLHRLVTRSYTVNSGTTYPASQPPDTFAYDRAGRMLSATHDAGGGDEYKVTFAYDNGGAVTSYVQDVTTNFSADNMPLTFAYAVDASTHTRTITYPGGLVVREVADKRGRITEIIDASTATPVSLAVNTYSASDRLLNRDFGNATEADWSYDNEGRVIRLTHYLTANPGSPLVDLSYERDKVGNPTCRENLVTSSLSEHYRYDAADRLDLFQRGDVNTNCEFDHATGDPSLIQQQAWGLDGLGNWSTNGVTINGNTVTEIRTHNKANEIVDITTDGTVPFTHDDNGNLTCDGTYYYHYDIENRLRKVVLVSNDRTISEHYYDALGRRVRKVVDESDDLDGDYRYLWNPDWQLMAVYVYDDAELKLRQRYVHAGSPSPWYSSLATSHKPLATAYIDDHIVMYKPGGGDQRKYFHADAQFTTQLVTDASSNSVASYVMSPYGKLETVTQPGGGGLGTYATNNAFLHQGLMYDAETGTYYNRIRILNLPLGRFFQRDRLPHLSGVNLYELTNSSPVHKLDPSGLFPVRPPIFIGTLTPPPSASQSCQPTINPSIDATTSQPNCNDCWQTCLEHQNLVNGIQGSVLCRADGCQCACIDEQQFPPNPRLLHWKIFRTCVIAHEEAHVSQEGSCCCNQYPCLKHTDEWSTTPIQDAFHNECAAAAAEIQCLESHLNDPGCDRICQMAIIDRIHNREEYCGNIYDNGGVFSGTRYP